MDREKFNTHVNLVNDCLRKAADEDNTLDRTVYYVGQANALTLIEILRELRSISKALEKDP